MEQPKGLSKKRPTLMPVYTFVVVLFLVLAAFIYVRTERPDMSDVAPGMTAEQLRTYANKLKEEGMPKYAAVAYEKYIHRAQLEAGKRANIYFLIGEAFMQAGMYEDALVYLYKTEIFDKKREHRKAIGINIVTCYEKLGKSLDAQAALDERVLIDEDKKYENARGALVAKIGDRMITMGEINDEIEKMPEWYQEKYKDEKEKAVFIQQFVVNKLLLKKGRMNQYDKTPDVQKRLQEVEESLIVQKVVQEEVGEISIDEHDLNTFYSVNTEKFIEKDEDGSERLKPLSEVREQAENLYRMEKSQAKMQALLSRLLRENEAAIFYQPPVESETDTSAEGIPVTEEVEEPAVPQTDDVAEATEEEE